MKAYCLERENWEVIKIASKTHNCYYTPKSFDMYDWVIFYPDFNYIHINEFINDNVYEVEVLGEVEEYDFGRGMEKYTNHVQFIRKLSQEEVMNKTNLRGNIGDNKGYYNTGNCNTGNRNTGNFNVGNHNTGSYNTGNQNVGYKNVGDGNTGDYNVGDGNTGDWNKCNFTNGCFNTITPGMTMFNKPTKWTMEYLMLDKSYRIMHDIFHRAEFGDLTIQECWDCIPQEDKDKVMKLPNFDAQIFFETTGIKV